MLLIAVMKVFMASMTEEFAAMQSTEGPAKLIEYEQLLFGPPMGSISPNAPVAEESLVSMDLGPPNTKLFGLALGVVRAAALPTAKK